jgi:transcriptional regulator with XRE-family HTH domain
MGKSSIAKHLSAGAGSRAALEVGRRVRARRLAKGMTQAELAAPLSRAFVSAVEKGRALPSLGSLWLFSARLGTDVGQLVDGVNDDETSRYTAGHDRTTIDPDHHSNHSNRSGTSTAPDSR